MVGTEAEEHAVQQEAATGVGVSVDLVFRETGMLYSQSSKYRVQPNTWAPIREIVRPFLKKCGAGSRALET